MHELPGVHFGAAAEDAMDWRRMDDPDDADDALLDETPLDVVALLGFDPLKTP